MDSAPSKCTDDRSISGLRSCFFVRHCLAPRTDDPPIRGPIGNGKAGEGQSRGARGGEAPYSDLCADSRVGTHTAQLDKTTIGYCICNLYVVVVFQVVFFIFQVSFAHILQRVRPQCTDVSRRSGRRLRWHVLRTHSGAMQRKAESKRAQDARPRDKSRSCALSIVTYAPDLGAPLPRQCNLAPLCTPHPSAILPHARPYGSLTPTAARSRATRALAPGHIPRGLRGPPSMSPAPGATSLPPPDSLYPPRASPRSGGRARWRLPSARHLSAPRAKSSAPRAPNQALLGRLIERSSGA